MRNKTKVLILLTFVFANGCNSALFQTIRENKEAKKRIEVKTQTLYSLEEQNRHLLSEKQRLADEVNQKSMTLNQLKDRLYKLKRENSRIKATTESEQKKKAALTNRINQYTEEINSLDSDPQLSIKAKEERIKELKQKIAEQLRKEY